MGSPGIATIQAAPSRRACRIDRRSASGYNHIMLYLFLVLVLASGAAAKATTDTQVEAEARFVCGDSWITFEPVELNEPPLKEVRALQKQVWTIQKKDIHRAFINLETHKSYLYVRFKDKPLLVYISYDTYWKTVECLN